MHQVLTMAKQEYGIEMVSYCLQSLLYVFNWKILSLSIYRMDYFYGLFNISHNKI